MRPIALNTPFPKKNGDRQRQSARMAPLSDRFTRSTISRAHEIMYGGRRRRATRRSPTTARQWTGFIAGDPPLGIVLSVIGFSSIEWVAGNSCNPIWTRHRRSSPNRITRGRKESARAQSTRTRGSASPRTVPIRTSARAPGTSRSTASRAAQEAHPHRRQTFPRGRTRGSSAGQSCTRCVPWAIQIQYSSSERDSRSPPDRSTSSNRDRRPSGAFL